VRTVLSLLAPEETRDGKSLSLLKARMADDTASGKAGSDISGMPRCRLGEGRYVGSSRDGVHGQAMPIKALYIGDTYHSARAPRAALH
jgi:hypothetical protein